MYKNIYHQDIPLKDRVSYINPYLICDSTNLLSYTEIQTDKNNRWVYTLLIMWYPTSFLFLWGFPCRYQPQMTCYLLHIKVKIYHVYTNLSHLEFLQYSLPRISKFYLITMMRFWRHFAFYTFLEIPCLQDRATNAPVHTHIKVLGLHTNDLKKQCHMKKGMLLLVMLTVQNSPETYKQCTVPVSSQV